MHSTTSRPYQPPLMPRTDCSPAFNRPIRYGLLPLQFDLQTDALLKNDFNKKIVSDIETMLSSNDTPRTDIDIIVKHALVNNYAHILKAIIIDLPHVSSSVTRDHLDDLDLNDRSAAKHLSGLTYVQSDCGPPADDTVCRLNLPESLKPFSSAQTQKYNPRIYQAIGAQTFAGGVKFDHNKGDKPGSNNFDPTTNTVSIGANPKAPGSYAIGPIVHELSHARDYMGLGHEKIDRSIHRSRQLAIGAPCTAVMIEAESLYTTEIKAWLLEAMQLYLVRQAGGELNRFQNDLIEGFSAGYDDILKAEHNYVKTRIVTYIGRLHDPKPTIGQLFAQRDTPLKGALSEGAALFAEFAKDAKKNNGEIDPNYYLNKLDSIFHTDFYPANDEVRKKEMRLVTLRSIMDEPITEA